MQYKPPDQRQQDQRQHRDDQRWSNQQWSQWQCDQPDRHQPTWDESSRQRQQHVDQPAHRWHQQYEERDEPSARDYKGKGNTKGNGTQGDARNGKGGNGTQGDTRNGKGGKAGAKEADNAGSKGASKNGAKDPGKAGGKGGGKHGHCDNNADDSRHRKRGDSLQDDPSNVPEPVKPRGKVQTRTTSTTLAHMTDAKFSSLGIHAGLARAVQEIFEYELMTKVQHQSIPICMKGGDVIAKAKTGTGKTLSFLIPALHNVLSGRISGGGVKVLVMSPTRELAMQTAEEGKHLLNFMPEHKVMTVLGGTNMNAEATSFRQKCPLLLVATPGRLDDHLNNSGLQPLCAGLRVLIFDEADQLLDMGFRQSIEVILKKLPSREERQTLLFSATFPAQLQAVTKIALRAKHDVVDTIGLQEEASVQQVEQGFVECTLDNVFEMTAAILLGLIKQPHKIMVFIKTARETALYALLFECMNLEGTKIMEIHSRKSQAQRTRISAEFRDAERAILFSSDVSARGMDYPDVTFVLQVGAPPDRAQYLHRLGRTARAGKEGAGLLLALDYERYFLKELKDIPLRKRPSPPNMEEATSRVARAWPALHRHDPAAAPHAYQAWLGLHKGIAGKAGWTSAELVEWANYYACDIMGCAQVPALLAKTIGMMGLKGVPGLVVDKAPREGGGRKGGGGKGGGKGQGHGK